MTLEVLRSDNYNSGLDKAAVKEDAVTLTNFQLKSLLDQSNKRYNLKEYFNGNSLKVDKKTDGFGTFDDGLLFKFPLDKYEHLSYYCRTSTPQMDTCNVKLFKRTGDVIKITDKEKIQYEAPIKRNETVLFARLGYHKYFKVNWDVDSMLFLQQEKDKWYKFDYIFSWEDHTVNVFVNHTLLTIQDFHMAVDPFAFGQGK